VLVVSAAVLVVMGLMLYWGLARQDAAIGPAGIWRGGRVEVALAG
jgi:hypothetical protein